MPKATRTLSGASQEKYFRDLFAAEPGLTREGAERLKALCSEEISQLRVRAPIPKRAVRGVVAVAQPHEPAPATTPDVPSDPPRTIEPEPEAPRVVDTDPVPEAEHETEATAPPPPFDPYAFSLVALLKRNGRNALRSRLDEISSPQNLHMLAEAQHIALPPGIDAPDDIREAIVNGAEQRLADRRAAAS